MSSITDLSLDGYPLLQTKSAVIPEVMTIFRETDRRPFLRKLSERNVLIWGEPSAHDTEETEVAVQYISEASKVADRLNVMGFTMRGVRDSFASARLLALDRAKSHLTDHELFRDEARLPPRANFRYLRRRTAHHYRHPPPAPHHLATLTETLPTR